MDLTVFTPSFNRAHTLSRTYASLCRQTCKDFKWVLVDDGSTDNTSDLVRKWIDDGIIQIEYYYKTNGGMASAHNEAYRHIDTLLAVCIDSDDWMPDDGVETIISEWKGRGSSEYAGIIGVDIYSDLSIVGTPFPDTLDHCRVRDMARKYKVHGDKKYVFRTDVIKSYLPYPEIKGERYGGVNYLYQVIDLKYEMLCSNSPYCIVEYQEDGLTANIFRQYRESPRTHLLEREALISALDYFPDRFRHSIHFVSCAIFAKDYKALSKTKNKGLVICAIPFGILLNIYVRIKLKQK